MGWSFGWDTRKELVEKLTRDWSNPRAEYRCIGKSGAGFTKLWTLWERRDLFGLEPDEAPPVTRFIVVFLLRYVSKEWGYKAVEESCGPTEVNCPLSYVERCTADPLSRYTHEWRDRVRAYHRKRGTGSGIKLKVGMTVPISHTQFRTARITSVKPLTGIMDTGDHYRLRRDIINFEAMLSAS